MFGLIPEYLKFCFDINLQVNIGIVKTIGFAAPENDKDCELHISPLRKHFVQKTCGEFKGSFKSGWAHLKAPCANSKKRPIPLEDAQFHLNQAGTMNTWLWWEHYENDKKTKFPYGYGKFYEDCKFNGESCVEIEFCEKCRIAEIGWKKNSADNF